MEISELLAGLKDHKDSSEVKDFVQRSLTGDIVKGFLATADGERLIKSGTVSAVESRITDALKTQQAKSQAELETERKGKLSLEEQVGQIAKRLEDAQRSQELSEKRARITKIAAEKNVPQDFLNILDLSKPDEDITAYIDAEAKRQEVLIKKGTDEARATSVKPGSGTAAPAAPDFTKMSSAEKTDFFVKQREERLTKTT